MDSGVGFDRFPGARFATLSSTESPARRLTRSSGMNAWPSNWARMRNMLDNTPNTGRLDVAARAYRCENESPFMATRTCSTTERLE